MRPKAPSPAADAAAQFPSPIPGVLGGAPHSTRGAAPRPLPGLTGLGGGFDMSLPEGCWILQTTHRESATPGQQAPPTRPTSLSDLAAARVPRDLQAHSGFCESRPDQPELLAARAPADQEVAASSPRADWLFAAAGARSRSRRREGAPDFQTPAGSRARALAEGLDTARGSRALPSPTPATAGSGSPAGRVRAQARREEASGQAEAER